ncbi:hypothetical protein jhhlp_001891 [Lomentospora prolificans]|uniref:Uncharacterized protein n=1 Tax=Lomentospora prolificans TaxID=41688 RepID=A0A2N3NCJ2_9PEZI|nr:hypothetical protein jhhlp_001891 [Lomentospora prolificans]
MALPRILPVVLGSTAIVCTSAILAIHIILTGHTHNGASVRASAVVSASLEGVVVLILSYIFVTYFLLTAPQHSKRFQSIFFGLSVVASTLATIGSAVTMVMLGKSKFGTDELLGANQTSFLIGASVALGIAFASQLVFLVVHFVLIRIPPNGMAESLHTDEEETRSARVEVKSIPYTETSPMTQRTRGTSVESRSPPSTSSGRSAVETMGSFRTSISGVVRPLSSRKLLSREKRSASLDSNGYHEQPRTTDDGFDSWDTSAVDPQNRQTVMQSSSPTPGRFLETIPASPTTSRSPSPGCPLDLEPPRSRNRSRSFSPAGTRRPRAPYAQSPNSSEAHIHPLFRSDSPTPPPMATPGTIVMAAPNAGQIISDRQSIRSLTRMRSGSLPTAPSPLSRQGSFDDFSPLRPAPRDSPPISIHEAPEEDEQASPERKMTPPIPDWILSAGTRTSLTDYNSRRIRSQSDAQPAPPQQQQQQQQQQLRL